MCHWVYREQPTKSATVGHPSTPLLVRFSHHVIPASTIPGHSASPRQLDALLLYACPICLVWCYWCTSKFWNFTYKRDIVKLVVNNSNSEYTNVQQHLLENLPLSKNGLWRWILLLKRNFVKSFAAVSSRKGWGGRKRGRRGVSHLEVVL